MKVNTTNMIALEAAVVRAKWLAHSLETRLEALKAQPPAVGDIIGSQRVLGVFPWRGGWMVVMQFDNKFDERTPPSGSPNDKDIPTMKNWREGQFQDWRP